MARRVPGMLVVAAGCLAIAGTLGYCAIKVFHSEGAAARFLGSLLGLGAFLVLLLAVACVVFAFGVDFK